MTGPRKRRVQQMRAKQSFARFAATAAIVAGLNACMAANLLSEQKGTSLEKVRLAATRAEVNSVLGEPVRSFTTPRNVTYAYYRYLADAKPQYANGILMIVGDIVTAGIAETTWLEAKHRGTLDRRPTELVAIAYDESDHVIGVFPDVTEFTNLPDDGRSTPVAQQPQQNKN